METQAEGMYISDTEEYGDIDLRKKDEKCNLWSDSMVDIMDTDIHVWCDCICYPFTFMD